MTGFTATVVAFVFILFLILRKDKAAVVKKTVSVKEDVLLDNVTKPGTSSGVFSGNTNRPLGKALGQTPCELRTEEYEDCLRSS